MNSVDGTPRILISTQPSTRPALNESQYAWRWLGWLSLTLALAGIGDWILAWLPMHFGSAEWEFGTVVSTFAGLPLITVGLAGMLGSAAARGVRWQVIATGIALLFFALWILAASVIFLLDVPVALRAVQGAARLGIMKAIAKTGMMGGLFFLAYTVIGIAALRFATRLRRV